MTVNGIGYIGLVSSPDLPCVHLVGKKKIRKEGLVDGFTTARMCAELIKVLLLNQIACLQKPYDLHASK